MKHSVTMICIMATVCLFAAAPVSADIAWYSETSVAPGLVTYNDTGTYAFPLAGEPTPHMFGGPSAETVFAPGDPIFASGMLDVMAITLPTLKPGVIWGIQSTYNNGVCIENEDVLSWGSDERNGDARFNTGSLTLKDPLGVVVWVDPGSSLTWDNIAINQSAGHDMIVKNLGVPGGYSYIYEMVRHEPIKPGVYTVEFAGYEGGVLAGSTQFTVVPVPGAVLLGAMGLGMVGWLKRRKQQG